MKKFFAVAFGAFLTMTVTPVSAAIQYKVETFSGGSWFSVDEKQTVYLNVKDKDGKAVSLGDSVISNIGWYKYNDMALSLLPGVSTPKVNVGDIKTGKLGEFSPKDKIVLWIETTNANGKKETFSMFDPRDLKHDIWLSGTPGDNVVFNWGDYVNIANSQKVANPAGFEFSITTNPPSGQPLPGILAVLAAGGIAFGARKLYRRKKNKIAK